MISAFEGHGNTYERVRMRISYVRAADTNKPYSKLPNISTWDPSSLTEVLRFSLDRFGTRPGMDGLRRFCPWGLGCEELSGGK
jgi:hypothetical protein